MVTGPGVEGQEVVQAPGEVVAAVGVDGLEEAQGDPDVHGHDVEVTADQRPDDGDEDGARAKDHGLDGGGVLCGEAKRRRILVMDLVDVPVEGADVQRAVEPVVPGILEDEEQGDLESHGGPGREGDAGLHSAGDGHGMEEPDLGQLDGEMAEEDELGAAPLLGEGWHFLALNLVLVEVGDAVDDDPGETAAEVDNLVHAEAQDAGSEDIVLHVGVPTLWVIVSTGLLSDCWHRRPRKYLQPRGAQRG